jgi:hypothetical protein
MDFGLLRALSIFFLDFRFPGPAQRFFALQRFFGLVRNRSPPSTLGMGLAGRPLLIPATLPVAPGPVAAAAARLAAFPFGPLLLHLWRRLLSLLRLQRLFLQLLLRRLRLQRLFLQLLLRRLCLRGLRLRLRLLLGAWRALVRSALSALFPTLRAALIALTAALISALLAVAPALEPALLLAIAAAAVLIAPAVAASIAAAPATLDAIAPAALLLAPAALLVIALAMLLPGRLRCLGQRHRRRLPEHAEKPR